MWIVTLLFLVPALSELLDPEKSQIIGIIWFGLAIATSPIYPASNRNRIFVILLLFVGFIMALMAEHAGILNDTINWSILLLPTLLISATLTLFAVRFPSSN